MHVNIPEANYIQTLCQSNLLNNKIYSLQYNNKVVFIDGTPESAALINEATSCLGEFYFLNQS